MDTKKRIYLLLSGAALIGLSVMVYFFMSSRYVYTNDARIEAFGVNLSPDMFGRVINLYVDEGDFVDPGQVIAQIDDDILMSQKAEKIAEVAAGEQQVEVQNFQYEKIRNNYERAIQGYEDSVISFQEFDHNQKDYEMAKAELDLARAELEQSKKQLEVINTKLAHLVINAPMKGVIAKRWALTGDVLQPGQSLFTMYDLDHVWVTALLEEKKIKNVRLGDRVKIRVDAYGVQDFWGEVFAIKGAAASNFSLIPQDNATGNYTKVEQRIPIKITLKNPGNDLYFFPGMNTSVYIYTK